MKKRYNFLAPLCGVVLAASLDAQAATTLTTVGVYDDDTSGVNVVDTNANQNPISATGPTDYLGFKANVANAFASGFGGVIDFENGGDFGSETTFSLSYANGLKSLSLTSDRGLRKATYSSAAPISGTKQIDLPDTNNDGTQTFMLAFGSISGGDANEAVTAIALTGNSRNSNAATLQLTVTFSDSTTAMLSDSLLGTMSADDTFYAFVAPAGLSITSLEITRSARIPFDDLAFITAAVPEPSSLGLCVGAVAMLGSFRHRRAKRN